MKKFIFYLFTYCFIGLNAQEWTWASHFGKDGLVTAHRSAIGGVDIDGNTYLVSTLSNDDKSDPWNIYQVQKIDKHGSEVWSKNINQYFLGRITTSLNGDSYICFADKIICINNDGNETWSISSNGVRNFGKVYLANNYLLVDGTEKVVDTLKSFIAKYTYTGLLLNTTYYLLPKFSQSIVASNENLVMVYDDLPDPITQNRERLSVSDNLGNLIFVHDTPHHPSQLISDQENNIYTSGWHEIFPININGIDYKIPGNFITKYSPAGKLLWYKIIEGSLGASSMTSDKDGNLIYVVDFSAHIKINEFEINHATGGLLIVKYDKDGNKVWHQFTPSYNTGPFGYLQPESIIVDQNNDLYLSGRISGTLQFGSSLLQTKSEMYTELFIGKLSQKNLVGLSETDKTQSFWQVFPNPSGNIFIIKGDIEEYVEVSVSNLQGQLITSGTLRADNRNVDLSAFAPGVYLLQIKYGERIETRKLVKN